MNIRVSYIVVGALAVFGLVSGCGGNGSSDASGGEISVATGSLSKPQFIKKADAICKEGTKEWEKGLGAFMRQQRKGPQPEQLTELVETVYLPVFEKEIAEVSSLGVPSQDQAQVTAILTGMQRTLAEGVEKPKQFALSQAPFGKVTKLATTYGFTDCGRP